MSLNTNAMIQHLMKQVDEVSELEPCVIGETIIQSKEELEQFLLSSSKELESFIEAEQQKHFLENDMEEAFIIYVGSHSKCFDIIDEIYKKYETKFWNYYIKSKYRNLKVKNLYHVAEIDSINKLIGILEGYRNGDISILQIEAIIKKLHPSIVKYCKKKPEVDPYQFIMNYGLKDETESYLAAVIIAMSFLSNEYQADFIGSSYITRKIVFPWRRDAKVSLEMQDVISKEMRLETIEEEPIEEFDFISFDEENTMSYGIITNKFIERLTLKEGIDFDKNAPMILLLQLKILAKSEMNIFQVLNTVPTTDDLIYIVSTMIFFKQLSPTFESGYEQLSYLLQLIFLLVLGDQYKSTKELYLNTSKEEKYQSILEQEALLHESRAEFLRKESNLAEQLRKIEEENKKLKAQLQEQNQCIMKKERECNQQAQEIEELKEKLEDVKKLNVDLMEIKSYVAEKDLKNLPSTQEMIQYLNQYKLIIFGGYDSTNLQLQTTLTDISVINHTVNMDISKAKNVDFIFVNTGWFSHPLYEQVTKLCKLNNKKFYYISGTNFELIIKQMYTIMIENEE